MEETLYKSYREPEGLFGVLVQDIGKPRLKHIAWAALVSFMEISGSTSWLSCNVFEVNEVPSARGAKLVGRLSPILATSA